MPSWFNDRPGIFYYPKKIFYFCIAIINYRNTIIIKDEKEIDSFMEERDRYASRKEKTDRFNRWNADNDGNLSVC